MSNLNKLTLVVIAFSCGLSLSIPTAFAQSNPPAISSECADAGVNPTEASRPFLTSAEKSEVTEILSSRGVGEDTQKVLVEKMEKGQLLDADNPEVKPVRTQHSNSNGAEVETRFSPMDQWGLHHQKRLLREFHLRRRIFLVAIHMITVHGDGMMVVVSHMMTSALSTLSLLIIRLDEQQELRVSFVQ